MRKPRRATFGMAGIAAGVAIVLVSISVANGSPIFWEHYGCVRGKLLASQYNWTPDFFWNAPYGGSVYGDIHYGKTDPTSGSLAARFFNGSVGVDFRQYG